MLYFISQRIKKLLRKLCWGPHWTIWFLFDQTITSRGNGILWEQFRSQMCFSKGLSGRAQRCWLLNSPLLHWLQNWPRNNFDQSAVGRSSLQDQWAIIQDESTVSTPAKINNNSQIVLLLQTIDPNAYWNKSVQILPHQGQWSLKAVSLYL